MRTNVHANLEEPEDAGTFAASQNAAMTKKMPASKEKE